MDTGFGLALVLAFAFALTNGFHDASNAIATLVATRAARPVQAVVLAAVALERPGAGRAVGDGGGPVSTTQVVASSVVGVGGGRRRWHHVHWAIVRHMGLAWLITMPVTAALAAVALVVWRWLA